MIRKLNKNESRQRWRELRKIWNEFDPIGVLEDPDDPDDEYESYLGHSMRLLEQNASDHDHEKYVFSVVSNMGLQPDMADIRDFIQKQKSWFEKNWPDTSI